MFIFGKQAAVDRVKAYLAMIESSTSSEQDGVFYLDVERDVPGAIQDYVKRAVPGVEITYDSGSRRFVDRHANRTARVKRCRRCSNLPPEDGMILQAHEQIPTHDRPAERTREGREQN